MENSDVVGPDGFPVQQYTINIETPIYPDKEKDFSENVAEMKNKNSTIWKNVYEKFLQFQPSTQKQISEYSKKSYRDISYIPISSKDSFKTIYIPCFAFKTHLFAYDLKDIDKTMKLDEIDSNKETHLNITSVDEFINVEFKPDCNINDIISTQNVYLLLKFEYDY